MPLHRRCQRLPLGLGIVRAEALQHRRQRMAQTGSFILDIAKIRARAREKLETGALTQSYGGSAEESVAILNDALATELVCVLRYKFHAAACVGINSESVRDEFLEHAQEEQEHVDRIADRISQLGGEPDYNPETLMTRSATEYVEGEDLVDMIKEDLIAERIAIETYREMVRHFAPFDPTTRLMLEEICGRRRQRTERARCRNHARARRPAGACDRGVRHARWRSALGVAHAAGLRP
jgi:bacterioferritin